MSPVHPSSHIVATHLSRRCQPLAKCMFGGGALAAKIVGLGFSQGSFLSA